MQTRQTAWQALHLQEAKLPWWGLRCGAKPDTYFSTPAVSCTNVLLQESNARIEVVFRNIASFLQSAL